MLNFLKLWIYVLFSPEMKHCDSSVLKPVMMRTKENNFVRSRREQNLELRRQMNQQSHTKFQTRIVYGVYINSTLNAIDLIFLYQFNKMDKHILEMSTSLLRYIYVFQLFLWNVILVLTPETLYLFFLKVGRYFGRLSCS